MHPSNAVIWLARCYHLFHISKILQYVCLISSKKDITLKILADYTLFTTVMFVNSYALLTRAIDRIYFVCCLFLSISFMANNLRLFVANDWAMLIFSLLYKLKAISLQNIRSKRPKVYRMVLILYSLKDRPQLQYKLLASKFSFDEFVEFLRNNKAYDIIVVMNHAVT